MPSVAFWDVDTQNDLMLPGGKLHVKGAEQLRPNLRKLYSWAKKTRVPVLATVNAHARSERMMNDWPEHCIRGTEGQKKLPETLLAKKAWIPAESSEGSEVPAERPAGRGPAEISAGVQVILEKGHLDAFTHPRARELAGGSSVEHWIVFGVATDYALRLAALGLLKLGKKVTVVSDATCGMAPDTSRQAVIEMQAAGADFKTTAAVLRSLAAPAAKSRRSKR
jgi:nicotinamidase/pyrazinamidase